MFLHILLDNSCPRTNFLADLLAKVCPISCTKIRRNTQLEISWACWIVGMNSILIALSSGWSWRIPVPYVRWLPWKLERITCDSYFFVFYFLPLFQLRRRWTNTKRKIREVLVNLVILYYGSWKILLMMEPKELQVERFDIVVRELFKPLSFFVLQTFASSNTSLDQRQVLEVILSISWFVVGF